MTSFGTRFLIVGLLVIVMAIPLFFIGEVISGRADLSRQTVRDVGSEWGGAQVIDGPYLEVPITANLDGEDGATRQSARAPLILLPDTLEIDIDSQTQIRRRGIFRAPVYAATASYRFDFDAAAARLALEPAEVADWDAAEITFGVTSNRALRREAVLTGDGSAIPLDPRTDGTPGFTARVGDIRDIERFELTLGLNGALALSTVPLGRETRVTMRSDWPDPSFFGAFLPDGSEITEDGFTANWTIPHLARPMPQITREDITDSAARQAAFGVRLIETNDFYQRAYRAARYSALFIALTFLTVLLTERAGGDGSRPAHPVHYIMIGMAQAVFVLLMVAYAEQIGFDPAYGLSAAATTILITLYGWTGLKLGRRAWLLGAVLIVTYVILYFVLRSTDLALLAGSTLAFVALALTMFLTRNEDWYDGDFGKLFQSRTGRERSAWKGQPEISDDESGNLGT